MNIAIAAITLDGKIALDSNDNTSWTSKADKQFFSQNTKKAGIIIFGNTTWQTIKRPLPDRHTIVMSRTPRTPTHDSVEFTTLPPKDIITELTNRGYQDIFIAGGQQIYTLFLNQQLLDQLWLTIEPRLFGTESIPLFNTLNSKNITLQLIETKLLTRDTLNLKYQIKYDKK